MLCILFHTPNAKTLTSWVAKEHCTYVIAKLLSVSFVTFIKMCLTKTQWIILRRYFVLMEKSNGNCPNSHPTYCVCKLISAVEHCMMWSVSFLHHVKCSCCYVPYDGRVSKSCYITHSKTARITSINYRSVLLLHSSYF